MGSGASTATPPSSPENSSQGSQRSVKNNLKVSSNYTVKQDENGENKKSCLVTTNHVAPVIIKNCKEEFQAIVDLQDPIVLGCLAEGMVQHPLLKGKFFLVNDRGSCVDQLKTWKKFQAVNVRQATGCAVFGLGQPTQDGFIHIVSSLLDKKHTEILVFNLREEPVFLIPDGDDMVSYSIRDAENMQDCVVVGKTASQAAEQEIFLRRTIMDLASLKDKNTFYFYNDMTNLNEEPHELPVQYEDFLLVSEEIYKRPCFNNPEIRYQRLCFPLSGAPSTMDVDEFIKVFKALPQLFLPKHEADPALIFICHSGVGRTDVGMVMGCLIMSHIKGFPSDDKKKIASNEENCLNSEFRVIQKLVQCLPNGFRLKNQVDYAIDACSQLINLREQISETKSKLDGINKDYIIDGHSAKRYLWDKCCQYLERYFFLICFNAYLNEQFEFRFCCSYSEWLYRHPELIRVRSSLGNTELSAPVSLVSTGVRYLVADDYIGLDVLSSQTDVQVSNFRKVTGLPVYGMAQPNRNGLCKVLSHLLNKKQSHPLVILINLRDDMVIDCDTETYSIRDSSNLEKPLCISGVTAKQIEEKEEKLKEELKKTKKFKVYQDMSNPVISLEISSVLTCKDMVEQQLLLTPELLYHRVPLDRDQAPSEQMIDRLMEILTKSLHNQTDEDGPGFVFHCRTGKSRTTTGMAIAGLFICHKKGFPYGARLGEQERVSCPNAQYTKGDFKVVQELVQIIPNGQQVKREVDFILDKCFDTMTPMHFHMREVIFVTYNKIKNAKTEWEAKQIRWRSLDYLERYIYLILFNAYLHAERCRMWKKLFSVWMKQVASKAGVYKILDNLAFYDFSPTPCELKSMETRWCNREPHATVRGPFI